MRYTLLICIIFIVGCSPYAVREFSLPDVSIPSQFHSLSPSLTSPDGTTDLSAEDCLENNGVGKRKVFQTYWKEFQNPAFESLIERALEDNFTVKESLARIFQSRARLQIIGADQFPNLSVGIGGSRGRIETGETILTGGFRPVGSVYQNNFFISNGFSFELDLWQRVASGVRAERYRMSAREADYASVQLLLSQSVFQHLIQLQEIQLLSKIVDSQIKTSETLLELTELRFSVNRDSALDVYEQRSQLAGLRAELPLLRQRLHEVENSLAVLLGEPPQGSSYDIHPPYPHLPEFDPSIFTPSDLLLTRPDLRSIVHDLQGSEYDVARAAAERFPKLRLGFSYDFSTSDLDDLFSNKTLLGSLQAEFPLSDGGRLGGMENLEEYQRDELLARFNQRFLESLSEVENALVAEATQRKVLALRREQMSSANAAFQESQTRYLNGVVEYLRVILSLQRKQQLERTVVVEERKLLENRLNLYISLGGIVPISPQGIHQIVPLEKN